MEGIVALREDCQVWSDSNCRVMVGWIGLSRDKCMSNREENAFIGTGIRVYVLFDVTGSLSTSHNLHTMAVL